MALQTRRRIGGVLLPSYQHRPLQTGSGPGPDITHSLSDARRGTANPTEVAAQQCIVEHRRARGHCTPRVRCRATMHCCGSRVFFRTLTTAMRLLSPVCTSHSANCP
eukprot:1975545-Rhodomonas_salina.3